MCNQSKRNGVACYYCRRKFNEDIEKTKDHIIAKSKGGYNYYPNLADCCITCNRWKADKTLAQWLYEVEKFHERGKHWLYTKIELGQIVGNIKKLIAEFKSNKSVSVYKPK